MTNVIYYTIRGLWTSAGLGTISKIVLGLARPVEHMVAGDLSIEPNETCEWHYDDDVATLTIRAFDLKGLPQALAYGGADLSEWEVDPKGVRFSQVTMRLRRTDETGNRLDDQPRTFTNWHIRLWRKTPELRSLELLLAKIEKAAPLVPKIKREKHRKGTPARVLEISIMDLLQGPFLFGGEEMGKAEAPPRRKGSALRSAELTCRERKAAQEAAR